MAEKIMLLDGNSLMNRAFYAMPLLTNKDGEFTNGVYGFLNIFFKLLDEEKPDYCAVCFDVHQPTFRHLEYKEYKGTRKGMPEELRPQMNLVKKVLASMNIKTFEMGGFEADDLLGTLAQRAEKKGITPVIVSGDRDLLQLATDTVKIRIPKTKSGTTTVEDYNAKDVEAVYGVTPEEFIEVKALMGDTSDNVPGVPSIGEKTAIKIIQEYKSVENAIANADKIKPKRASENLALYGEQARQSKWLVTIKTDVPIEFNIEETALHNIFNENSYSVFKQYEFKSMLNRFDTQKVQEKHGFNYILIKSASDAERVLADLNPFEECGYKLIAENNDIKGIAVTQAAGKAYVFRLSEGEILTVFKDFFENQNSKIAHNGKSDIVLLKRKGIDLNNIIFDTMIGGYIINSSMDNYEYNELAEDFLGESYPSEEEILGKGKSKKSVADLSDEEFTEFCGRMCDISFRSYSVIDSRLKENSQQDLYYKVELPLIYVLAHMELAGMGVDRQGLIDYGKSLDGKIEELTKDIYWLAGEEFNINSPKQLSYILFEKLGLKGGKKTKTGWSTSADILEKLKDKDEIAGKVLEYRSYSKLKSTYADGLLALLQEDDRIYSTFNQTITTTGRISSTEPNLQNIPVRIELGRQLRKVFIPKKDCVYIDADYSQIELRVLAHLAGDENLINAFKENQDIHTITASQVFNVPVEEVTPLQRRNAKAVNFGIIYGIGAFSLSQDLGITKKEADIYIESYFAKYPKIKAFIDGCVESAKELGYGITIFNRRRYIPEISSSNFQQRSFGERVAMNMPVQGTAADIIKIAMVKVYNRMKREKLKSQLVLQVHDELLIEAYNDERETVSRILREEMENAVELSVPLVADVHSGNTWYDVK
ncbi:MAG: DNA polymerase I [Clostridia bacterium]|nr:DNA polymerase I [Clostridia bacterium]